MAEQDAQDAIDATAANQGQADSISPAVLSIRQQDIWDNPKMSNVDINQNVLSDTAVPVPGTDQEIPTGVGLVGLRHDDDFAVGVVFTFMGNTYAVKDRTNVGAILTSGAPDLRQSRTSEAVGTNSQVKMFYWYDDVLDDIKLWIEVDGGGITIQGARVVVYGFDATLKS